MSPPSDLADAILVVLPMEAISKPAIDEAPYWPRVKPSMARLARAILPPSASTERLARLSGPAVVLSSSAPRNLMPSMSVFGAPPKPGGFT